ncbi:MAG: hypothetical protein H0X37_10840 [Herpetosiphonaceae bacterium]|nr:hypothetical protein [Herpetosiphonaceae bacterium]
MTTKELVQAEIERVSDEHLDELYQLVKSFAEAKASVGKPSLMSRLKHITIEAPEDFAANLDSYTDRENRADTNLC